MIVTLEFICLFLLVSLVISSLIAVNLSVRYKRLFRRCVQASMRVGCSMIRHDWQLLLEKKETDNEIKKAWLRIAQNAFELFSKKQHDYGDYNIKATGFLGVLVRINDKVARLYNLTTQGQQVSDENRVDTIDDLINYLFFARMFLTNELEEDTIISASNNRNLLLLGSMYQNLSADDKSRFISGVIASEIADDIGGDVSVNYIE